MAQAAEYANWIVQNRDKQGTPDFETVAQAYEVAKRNENAVATQEAQKTAPASKSGGIVNNLIGAGETALTLGTAATGGLFGTVGGAITGLREQIQAGKFGTPEGAKAISDRAAAGAQQYTYMPRTEAGQEQVQAIGELSQMLPPVLPGALPDGMFGQSVRNALPIVKATGLAATRAVQQGGKQAVQAVQRTPSIVREAFGMETAPAANTGRGSVGAAGTPMGMQREATAKGLPVNVDLTLGGRERDPTQLAFELEQMKGPHGAPLRERAELNNSQFLQNFDAIIDMTGSQTAAIGPAATGNAVIDALSKGWQGAKAKTSAAYLAANKSPESLVEVDLITPRTVRIGADDVSTTLFDYLNSQPSKTPTSAIPDAARQIAVNLGIAAENENGKLVPLATNVKTMEQFRTDLNASTDFNPVNIYQTVSLKKLIDAATDEVAGPLYKEARAQREKQRIKYEGRGVVANLITKVRGKDDAKIDASEAFQKSILNGTPEDVTFLRRVLLTSGKDGQKALKELQGATVKHLENVATSGLQTDSMGRPIVSTAKLNGAVNALDADGRLDIILGKQQAQVVRDLNEVVKYVNTVPPGTLINSSGTAMALMAAMGEAGLSGALVGLPIPVLSLIKVANTQIKNNKVKARINQALNKADVVQ